MLTTELPARKDKLQRDLTEALQKLLNEFKDDTGLTIEDVKFDMLIYKSVVGFTIREQIVVNGVYLKVRL